MSSTASKLAVDYDRPSRIRRGARGTWAYIKANPHVAVAAALLLLVVAAAIAAPVVAPYDPTALDPIDRLRPPGSPHHVLGTDAYGRDLLSRIIWGGRLSLVAGLVPASVTMLVGLTLGLISGYARGAVDSVIMGVMNVLLAFPFMLLAIVLVAALGPSLRNAMLALIVSVAPARVRVVRGEVLSWTNRPFLDAARVLGFGHSRLLFREILPNVLPVALALFTIDVAIMMVGTAGLSFLGLGVHPPQSDWGTLVADGKDYLFGYSYLTVIPSIVLGVVTLAIAVLGDAVQEALNPRLVAESRIG